MPILPGATLYIVPTPSSGHLLYVVNVLHIRNLVVVSVTILSPVGGSEKYKLKFKRNLACSINLNVSAQTLPGVTTVYAPSPF